jgi:hypothetical protein
MSLFGSIAKKVLPSIQIKKRVFDPEKMSIEDISLPGALKHLDLNVAKNIIKEELSTYKSLGYKDKPLEEIKVKEYHSYQMGVVLRCIKEDMVYFIPNVEQILPSMVTYNSARQLHIKVFDIVFRYDNSVEKDDPKDELSKDIRWSPLDMAYLLYYLSLENKRLPKR